MIYLDASAIVKLVRAEPETRALFSFLTEHVDRVTSVVSAVEVRRAVTRSSVSPGAARRADRVLERLAMIELDDPIRRRAAALQPTTLRTLNSIHVASALDLGRDVSAFVTYDERQAVAARRARLAVVAPD